MTAQPVERADLARTEHGLYVPNSPEHAALVAQMDAVGRAASSYAYRKFTHRNWYVETSVPRLGHDWTGTLRWKDTADRDRCRQLDEKRDRPERERHMKMLNVSVTGTKRRNR